MTAHNHPARVTAQIACEAIVNHEGDGYSLADMIAVFEVATTQRVAPLYVDMLADRIADAVAAKRAEVER